jgi:uncharacterized protein
VTLSHLTGVVAAIFISAAPVLAQVPPPPPVDTASVPFVVFFRSQPVGREDVAVIRQADGWIVRGSSRQGPPIDITTRVAEVIYDTEWRPRSLLIDGIVRGQDVTLKTTFADGKASNVILVQGAPQTKVDAVSADTIVLPNSFLGSYAALARRLQGKAVGAELRAYIAPQAEAPMRVTAVGTERIDTPKATLAVTRYTITLTNPPPGGELQLLVWIDAGGNLLRLSVPAQALEVAREDIASAASRTAAFSAPGDEAVQIPAAGFNLAATITKPAKADGLLPALVLIGGSGAADRDETMAGVPVFGHFARDLAAAGFLVVRYDKRGVGQSGGRAEAVTLGDYAEDTRAVLQWLDKRKDVDKKRIGVVGYSEGAAVAMLVAARERNRVSALALLAGISTTGSAVVLEQQKRALDQMQLSDAERAEKLALQVKVNDAVIKGTGWEGVPDALRKAADTPWFQSYLSFDAARAMRDVRQPLLVVQGELDTEVPPYHADGLVTYAKARKGAADVQAVKVPGLNHLFVAASDTEVSKQATSAVAEWMTRTLGHR